MPTPVAAARQCLAAEAATALDDAVAVASRRRHAQTTSLHVVSGLLSLPSSSPSPLRDALSRSRPLHSKAIHLCFSSALDRLPATSQDPDPPISNSLMAAIKRSQANQRRNPETFHLYQSSQQPHSPTFAGVKVDLQQLILAILDDPVVSRVFAEAGFRSCDIKLAVLRPPPSSVLRFPRAARCPPLFLCNFSTSSDDIEPFSRSGLGFPFAKELLSSDGSEEHCRRIGEVMARRKGRNPLLVGAGAAAALRDFGEFVGRRKDGILPREMAGVTFFTLDEEEKEGVKKKLEEVRSVVGEGELGCGALLSFGDLKMYVEEEEEEGRLGFVVEEVTKMLGMEKGKLWLMGSSASYETYMKFLAKYPSVDKDWDLQLLPITSVKVGSPGSLQRHSRIMESLAPHGGFFPVASSPTVPLRGLNQHPQSRCRQCTEKYEQEVATVLKDCSLSSPDKCKVDLPSWLQNAELTSLGGLDITKASGDQMNTRVKVADIEKKWNDYCQSLHHSFTSGTIAYHAGLETFPRGVGFPSISGKGSPSKASSHADITQCLSIGGNTSPLGVKVLLTKPSLSLSIPAVEDDSSGLQISMLNYEQPETSGLKPCLFSRSHIDIDGNRASTSIASVSTDLTLATVHDSPHKEGKPSSRVKLPGAEAVSRYHSFPKSSVITKNVSAVPAQSSICSSYLEPLPITTKMTTQKSSNLLVKDTGFSVSENQDSSFSSMPDKIDLRDFKTLYKSLIEKVGRQEEALCAISETITRCRTGNGRCRGMWLAFLGPDRKGKKMIAATLSELLFGSRNKLIHANLDSRDDNMSSNVICNEQGISGCDEIFRGKMAVDHIAGEIRRKPFSVVLLENVDKADLIVQSSLSQAVKTGRFCDSHGREISVRNTVFIATAGEGEERDLFPGKKHGNFSEEKILAAQKWQMKIQVKSIYKRVGLNAGSSDTPRREFNDIPCSPCFTRANKRKLDISDEGDAWYELHGTPKKALNTALDLNVPFDDTAADAESSNNECGSASDCADSWLEEFTGLIDGAIKFKPFDFGILANNITKEINKCLRNSISAACILEIDTKAMEQMLAATWSSDVLGALNNWLQQVLMKSFREANERYNLSNQTILRLVACEDSYMEEQAPGICLPSRIHVD